MATKPLWTRAGLALECNVSETPRRRPSSAYALPDLQPVADSLLTLTLEAVPGSGRKAIRVTSQALPSAPTITWGLEHFAYQGSRPATPTWEQLVCLNPVNTLLADAMPSAVHVFRLTRAEAGQVKTLPEKSITTPADAVYADLQAILSDDTISKAEKPLWNAMLQQLLTGAATDRASAVEWGVDPAALDATTTALQTHLAGLTPPLTDATLDTPLGTGGGAVLEGKYTAVINARKTITAQVETARKAGLDTMLGDDKVTPGEKRRLKQERDQIQAVKSELDAVAVQAVLDPAAVDAAVAAFESFLDGLAPWNPTAHDWDDYTTTASLGTGNGALLYAKIQAVRAAEADFRRLATGNLWQQIQAYGNDAVLSKLEKPQVALEWARVQAEYTQLKTNAEACGTYTGYYVAAYNALSSYLTTLSPAYNDQTQDTPINATSWKDRWEGYYTERMKVIGNMAVIANSKADAAALKAPEPVTSLPFPPGSSWPAGRQAWLIYDQVYLGTTYKAGPYRSTGPSNGWAALPYDAELIVGRLTANQLALNIGWAGEFQTVNYAELNGKPIAGAKMDGRNGQVPWKVGPQGMLFGSQYIDDPVLRSLVGIDGKYSSSTSYYVVMKGNNDPATNMGAPNPSCCSISANRIVDGSSYDLWLFTITLTPTGFSDNLDNLCGGFIDVKVGGSSVCLDAPFSIGPRSYASTTHSAQANRTGTSVVVAILSAYRNSTKDITVQLKNTYFWSNAFFTLTGSGAGTPNGTTTTSGTSSLGSGTVGGGVNARQLLLQS